MAVQAADASKSLFGLIGKASSNSASAAAISGSSRLANCSGTTAANTENQLRAVLQAFLNISVKRVEQCGDHVTTFHSNADLLKHLCVTLPNPFLSGILKINQRNLETMVS